MNNNTLELLSLTIQLSALMFVFVLIFCLFNYL